jgi:hypothetical protein
MVPFHAAAAAGSLVSSQPQWLTELEAQVGGDGLMFLKQFAIGIGIFLGGWIAAKVAAWLIFKTLKRTDLDDKIAARLGFDLSVDAKGQPRDKDALERGVARGVYYTVMFLVLISLLEHAGLSQAAGPIQTLVDTVAGAIPFVAKAALILGAAYLVGLALSKLVNRGLSALNLDARLATEDRAPDAPTMGEAAGKIMFWVVMTFGLAGAFDALRIDPISGPLHNALDRVVTFLPSLAVAAALLGGGWFLGKLARTVISNLLSAVSFDEVAGKLKIDKLLGEMTPSMAGGTVVMAFVVLQAAIAALQELGLSTLSGPLTDMMAQLWRLLPALGVSVLVVAVAVVIGRILRGLVTAFLENVGFDRGLAKLGLSKLATREDLDTPSKIAGLVAQVVVIAVGLTQALENLDMHTWSGYVDSALGFTLEHVLVALLIVAVGLAIGNYVGDMVRARMSTAEGDVNWMAEFARGGVYVLAFTMALNQLSVGEDIVIIAFAMSFGGLCLAAALAFGLGGKDLAGEVVRKRYQQARAGGGLPGGGMKAPTPKAPVVTPKPQV